MTIVVIALVAVAAAQASTPATLPGEACTPSALVGTWKVIEAKQGTETIPTRPTDPTEYKELTPTHFMVFQVAAESAHTMIWAHGGTYTLAGGTYTENIQYGFGQPYSVVSGKSFAFQCSVDSDGIWHIAGDVAGTPIVETWKRVSN
jgi:hypothetical protein